MNKLTDLMNRLGFDLNPNEEITPDEAYRLALDMDKEAFRCGYYLACSQFLPWIDLVPLAQLRLDDPVEWRARALEIVTDAAKRHGVKLLGDV